MSSWLELCTIFLLIASIPISCKLYHGLLCLANCTISKPCKLTSCKLYHNLLQSESCKLSTCKLSSCKLSFLNLCTLSSCKLLVRTYVFHMLRTYVMILCNWLILWQNALYLYLDRLRMCLNTSRNHVLRSSVEAFKSVQEIKQRVQIY